MISAGWLLLLLAVAVLLVGIAAVMSYPRASAPGTAVGPPAVRGMYIVAAVIGAVVAVLAIVRIADDAGDDDVDLNDEGRAPIVMRM